MENFFSSDIMWHNSHVTVTFWKLTQDRVLETKVNQNDIFTNTWCWVGCLSWYLLNIVGWQNSRTQLILQVLDTVTRISQSRFHGTVLTDNLSQGTCINTRDTRDVFCFQKLIQGHLVTPVAGTTAGLWHNDTLSRWLNWLIVVTVNAVVTNKWISKSQNLTIVRLVCDRFLITCHTSIKDDFTRHIHISTEGLTFKNSAVFQNK